MKKRRPKLPATIETIAAAGEQLTASERWLLVVIASHAGGFVRESFPGRALLSTLTGLDPRTVQRLVTSCEEKGWLRVSRPQKGEPQRSNRYLVTPSAEARAVVARLAAERAARKRAKSPGAHEAPTEDEPTGEPWEEG